MVVCKVTGITGVLLYFAADSSRLSTRPPPHSTPFKRLLLRSSTHCSSVGTLNLERSGKLTQMNSSRLEVLLPRIHSIGSRGLAGDKRSRNKENQGSHSRSPGNHWEGLLPRGNHGSNSERRTERSCLYPAFGGLRPPGEHGPPGKAGYSQCIIKLFKDGSTGVRLLGFKPQL